MEETVADYELQINTLVRENRALHSQVERFKEREPQWQEEVKQAKDKLAAAQARITAGLEAEA
jgi:hypothetical protein